jgi:hypothetical protein
MLQVAIEVPRVGTIEDRHERAELVANTGCGQRQPQVPVAHHFWHNARVFIILQEFDASSIMASREVCRRALEIPDTCARVHLNPSKRISTTDR